MSDYRAAPGTGTGIYYDPVGRCWWCKIYRDGVRISLGRFSSHLEAKEAQERALQEQEADNIAKVMRGQPVTPRGKS
jgi:hypothetical protein